MTFEEICEHLKVLRKTHTAVQLANQLAKLNGQFSQGILTMYFKSSFPEIPLRLLLEAGAWHRVSDGRLSDDAFNLMLSPWIPEHVHTEIPEDPKNT